MVVFDVFNPLENVTLQFTEGQVQDFLEWFDGAVKPLLTINDGEPINVITVEQFTDFLKLKKIHRRSFHYPSYAEVMKEVEHLNAQVLRVLTKEQFLYMLNLWVIKPKLKHELLMAFQIFDTEKRNFLEIDELKHIVTTFGVFFTEKEVIELLRDANVRGDGNIFYEDFVESMFNRVPELYDLETDYLYENPDEDPSVPPEPEPETETEPVPVALPPPAPPPPPPPAKPTKGKKKK